MEITCRKCGDYYLPNIGLPENTDNEPLGKYGRMRRQYIKEYRPILWDRMILTGTLFPHLHEIDRACYDRMDALEDALADVESRLHNIRQQKISGDNVYQYLLYFDRLYDRFTDKEKKEFLNSFVDRIEIYEDEQPDGRFLKSISFKFPVFYDGQEIRGLSWDNEATVDTVVWMSRAKD